MSRDFCVTETSTKCPTGPHKGSTPVLQEKEHYFPRAKSEKRHPVGLCVNDVGGRWETPLTWATEAKAMSPEPGGCDRHVADLS